MWNKIKEYIDNPFQTSFIIPLLIINIVGSIWGYIWYQGQLAQTPIKYWLFVPDCPFATTLMSIVLIFFLFGKRNSTLELITYTALIKYGAWTVFVLSIYGITGGQYTQETWLLLISHLGMVIQGFFFLRFIKIQFRDVFIVTGWMFLNDYMDYVIGVYPYLPNPKHLPIVTIFTLSISLVTFLLMLNSKIIITKIRKF